MKMLSFAPFLLLVIACGGQKITLEVVGAGTTTAFRSAVSDEEAGKCSNQASADAQKIVITGNDPIVQLPSDKASVIEIAGNLTNVTLKVESPQALTARGICLLARGNQAKVNVEIASSVENLHFTANGNQAVGEFEVKAEGKLSKSFTADLSGNESRLKVFGEGSYVCPTALMSGNGAAIECGKD